VTSSTGLNPDAEMPMLDWGSWLPKDSGIPAFTYDFSISYSKNNTNSSCLWTYYVYHIPLSALWTFKECLFLSPAIWTMNMQVYPFFKCWNVGLSGIQLVHTGMNKNFMSTYRIKLLSARSIYSLLMIHLAGHYMNWIGGSLFNVVKCQRSEWLSSLPPTAFPNQII
jgi:hypothetical protein